MRNIYYDTYSLLLTADTLFDNPEEQVIISSVSLRELEDIKSSDKKDADVKYAARHLTRILDKNKEKFITDIYYDLSELIKKYNLPDNNDSRILISAYNYPDEVYFCC